MDGSPLQFPLPLKLDTDASLTNYWPHKLGAVQAALQQLFEKETEQWLFISAMKGAGKSHLLQALVHRAEETGQIAAYYVDCAELLSVYQETSQSLGDAENTYSENLISELFAGFEGYELLCFDNVQLLSSSLAWQKALFYLLVKLKGLFTSKVVFAADNTIDGLQLELPDLISRLKNAEQYQLDAYSDGDKANILIHRAKAEGMELSDDVARFIVERAARDMHSLIHALKQLNQMTLAKSRKLTIPFVKDVLKI